MFADIYFDTFMLKVFSHCMSMRLYVVYPYKRERQLTLLDNFQLKSSVNVEP